MTFIRTKYILIPIDNYFIFIEGNNIRFRTQYDYNSELLKSCDDKEHVIKVMDTITNGIIDGIKVIVI